MDGTDQDIVRPRRSVALPPWTQVCDERYSWGQFIRDNGKVEVVANPIEWQVTGEEQSGPGRSQNRGNKQQGKRRMSQRLVTSSPTETLWMLPAREKKFRESL